MSILIDITNARWQLLYYRTHLKENMPVAIKEVFDILTTLADDENLKVCVKSSLTAGSIAAVSTTIGGLIGGPVGVTLGGVVGTAAATYYAKGKFMPLSQALREMPADKKKLLYERVTAFMDNLGVEDAIILGKLIIDDSAFKQELLSIITNQVSKEMHMQIVD